MWVRVRVVLGDCGLGLYLHKSKFCTFRALGILISPNLFTFLLLSSHFFFSFFTASKCKWDDKEWRSFGGCNYLAACNYRGVLYKAEYQVTNL